MVAVVWFYTNSNKLQTCTTESSALRNPDDSQCHSGILQQINVCRVLKTHSKMGKETIGWASGPITHGCKSEMH